MPIVLTRPMVLLDARKSSKVTGDALSTFYKRVKDGILPKPIKIGGSSRWIEEELEACILALREAQLKEIDGSHKYEVPPSLRSVKALEEADAARLAGVGEDEFRKLQLYDPNPPPKNQDGKYELESLGKWLRDREIRS